MNILEKIERKMLTEKNYPIEIGDTVRVNVRVVEGSKEREQAFQGVVIQRRGSGAGESFTVRKISSGIGVERIFPLHSPNIKSVEVVRRGRVRRAKLYYLRDLVGKAARIPEKRTERTKGPKGSKK
jgi:large subunit ribosomal protein L19